MENKRLRLSEILVPAKPIKAGNRQLPILSMTMRGGLVDQADKFKKRIASIDTSPYKVVTRNQLVVGFPIDEGVLSFQALYDEAIVSPAYDIWNLKDKYEIHPPYLQRYLRSPQALHFYRVKLRGTTARRRTLPDDVFLSMEVPVPSITEQHRIAAILDKADTIRRKRRQAIDLMNDFLRSVFLEMFGDPESNPKKWKVSKIEEVIEHFEGGKSFKSPEDDNVEGKTRILKISAISWGEFNPSESKPVPSTYVPPKNHFVRQGDLLISRANTSELVGAVSYVFDPPPPVILPDKLWRFVFCKDTQVRPLYLLVLFQQQAIRNELSRLGTGTSGSMKNISMGKLMGMKIPVPDLKLQSTFEERFLKYRQAVTAMNRELGLANELSLSLQNDLFGE